MRCVPAIHVGKNGLDPFCRSGIFANAALTGLVTVVLPLQLDEQGATKTFIALYFVATALTTASLNFILGRRIRRINSPGRWICALHLVSATGLILVANPPTPAVLNFTGPMVMASGLAFSFYVSIADRSDRSQARTASSVRLTYVLGYVAGLGAFSVVVQVQARFAPWLIPAFAAAGLAVLNALLSLLPMPIRHTAASDGKTEVPMATSRIGTGWLVFALSAFSVMLARSADSLRQVYLPLYSVHTNVPRSWIAALFAVGSMTEILVLYGIGRVGERIGSGRAMRIVCCVGAVSFGLMAVSSDLWLLLLSQVLYATFGAGFQSFGMLLIANALQSELGKSAAIYTALTQIGSTVGMISPLVLPGYTPRIFLIATAFCLVAGFLAKNRRTGSGYPSISREQTEAVVVQPSGRSQH